MKLSLIKDKEFRKEFKKAVRASAKRHPWVVVLFAATAILCAVTAAVFIDMRERKTQASAAPLPYVICGDLPGNEIKAMIETEVDKETERLNIDYAPYTFKHSRVIYDTVRYDENNRKAPYHVDARFMVKPSNGRSYIQTNRYHLNSLQTKITSTESLGTGYVPTKNGEK